MIARTRTLDDLIDARPVDRALLTIVAAAMAVLISDGFDLAAMGYLAPELAHAWGLGPADFVPAFSAGIVGMMVGGPLLGWLGDRYGRKRLILAGLVAIGLLTLATTAVQTTAQLVMLRFLTGVGLGGVIPNVGALVAELAPKRVRGRLLVIVTLGVPIGIALPGLVAATLLPLFGWRAMLLIGGTLPLLAALGASMAMPESIKYLLARGDRSSATAAARKLRLDLPPESDALTALTIGSPARLGAFRDLFAGPLLVVTPLLWLCQAANQMANFFALTWLPTLLQAGGGGAEAGGTASLFSLGGLASGLILLLVLDRAGTIPVLLLFLLGTPLVAALALTDLSPGMHALVIVGAGACVTGVQIGLTALLGMFYPTPVRSMGTGWTQAAGRVGALAAPLVGGLLLQWQVPMQQLPLAPAALMAIGTLACAALAWRCVRRFGGFRPGEFAPDVA